MGAPTPVLITEMRGTANRLRYRARYREAGQQTVARLGECQENVSRGMIGLTGLTPRDRSCSQS